MKAYFKPTISKITLTIILSVISGLLFFELLMRLTTLISLPIVFEIVSRFPNMQGDGDAFYISLVISYGIVIALFVFGVYTLACWILQTKGKKEMLSNTGRSFIQGFSDLFKR